MRGHALADVQLRTAVVYTAAPEALPSRRSAPHPSLSLVSLVSRVSRTQTINMQPTPNCISLTFTFGDTRALFFIEENIYIYTLALNIQCRLHGSRQPDNVCQFTKINPINSFNTLNSADCASFENFTPKSLYSPFFMLRSSSYPGIR